jgi:hypothetical protein
VRDLTEQRDRAEARAAVQAAAGLSTAGADRAAAPPSMVAQVREYRVAKAVTSLPIPPITIPQQRATGADVTDEKPNLDCAVCSSQV